LIKVGLGRFAVSGYYGFTFRVADAAGRTIPGLTSSLSPSKAAAEPTRPEGYRWYRLPIPPGCVAVVPPSLRHPFRMFLNGKELFPSGTSPIDFKAQLTSGKNVFTLVAGKDDRLSGPVEFVTGFRPFELTPWTQTGLANFSGRAVYEKDFNLPDQYRDKKLILDCGRVSSVAEVLVNGRSAGTAVWRPFRVDITKLVRPGPNRLRLLITNTEANRRAVGTYRRILKNIDVDGLEGPVVIIPYLDTTLDCVASSPGQKRDR
jgi:hypothetical protein